jgi:hypothetical protein
VTERATAISRSPSDVARACLAAHRDQDWERLRALFHPQARIGTFAGGGRPEDSETALTRLREAHQDFIYHADVNTMVELSEEAFLLAGRVQYRDGYGMADSERCWLYVVRDGLLYRSAVYRSSVAARTEYEVHGSTLGVADEGVRDRAKQDRPSGGAR